MTAKAEVRGARRTSHPAPRTWMWVKAGVWVLALVPLALLLKDGFTDNLTAEPVKEITHRTGWWALTLLFLSLAVTPVRRLTGFNQLVKLRRLLGLFAFFYATLHVLVYFGLDQAFSLAYIGEDILERPYITVGFTAWVILLALAATSTQASIRRLGKRWQLLHRLVYLAAILGVLHFLWLVKADTDEPLFFAGILTTLLAYRLPFMNRKPPQRGRVPGKLPQRAERPAA